MKRKIIKFFLYSIILLAIGLISGHLTFELLSYGKTVEMPDLRGKNIEEAQMLLSANKLYLRVDGEEYDNYLPQGFILRQDIKSGYKLKEGREIGVILSKGPRIRDVPDLIGKTLDSAETILKDKGLRINKIIYVHSSHAEKNIILAQRPEPLEKGGNFFTVVVSLGNFPDEEVK